MKHSRFTLSERGSALITVIFLVFILGLLTTSMLRYTGSEQRMNERQRLMLRSRNMSENVVIYASEQITNKLYRIRSGTAMAFKGANAVALPPNDVLRTPYSTEADVEVLAALTTTSNLTYIDPTDPANAGNPNAGLQVKTSQVPIIAKSKMVHPAIGPVTTYAEQDLEVAMMPLFQFAVFYNMDMEFGPGPNMMISGPVHTNGNFIARIQSGFSNTLEFDDRVTSAKGFFANTAHKGSTYMANGTADNGPGGSGPLYFRPPGGSDSDRVNIRDSSGVWRDHKWSDYSNVATAKETDTSRAKFKSFATSTYKGNLRTSVHGVTELKLPSIGDYDESDATKKKNGRQIIEPPLTTDEASVRGTKISRNAGLYICVNPDDATRNGHRPDGTVVSMRARSYRAWLNSVSDSGVHTVTEVILPGQPSYGPLNAFVNTMPNAYRVDTSVGSNQVLRTAMGRGTGFVDIADSGYAWSGSLPDFDTDPSASEILTQDAYFYDMRRAYNNVGIPANRPSLRFRPRPITKIDFDITRFKMAIDRSFFGQAASSVFNPNRPSDDATWGAFIYNPGASKASYGLGFPVGTGTAFSDFPARDRVPTIRRTQAGAYLPASLLFSSFQGVTTGTASGVKFRVDTTVSTPTSAGVYGTWTSGTATSSATTLTYALSSAPTGVTAIRVRQYRSTSAATSTDYTDVLDEQVIPVIDDTTTAVVGSLTNDRYIVPLSGPLGLLSNSYNNCFTEMRVFVGGVDDTANWTFSFAGVSGVTAYLGGNSAATNTSQTGSGPFANRLVVTLSPSGSQANIVVTATKRINGGTTSITRTFAVIPQNSLIPSSPALPWNTGYWVNAGGGVSPDPFRLYRAPVTSTEVANSVDDPSPFLIDPSGVVGSGNVPWFDGVTVYIESCESENLTTTGTGNAIATVRNASGVRLWNGRGGVPTLTDANRTGMSFATNDAVYIVGHFNADGTMDPDKTHKTTGGYSGAFPESANERLAAVMGDALTILSQPEFTRSSGFAYQTKGWTDSLSGHRCDSDGNWSTNWTTTDPSNSNTLDGISDTIQLSLMPNLTVSSSVLTTDTASAMRPGPRATSTTMPTTNNSKNWPSDTEVSACILTGIVPTKISGSGTSGQTSGGVHNFPRLSENWAKDPTGQTVLYIRGSMVAMFESQVATEPWGIRWYQGAVRNWGLHQSLRDANHDVPLEPIVLGARRMSYRELTQAEFDTQKTTINAIP